MLLSKCHILVVLTMHESPNAREFLRIFYHRPTKIVRTKTKNKNKTTHRCTVALSTWNNRNFSHLALQYDFIFFNFVSFLRTHRNTHSVCDGTVVAATMKHDVCDEQGQLWQLYRCTDPMRIQNVHLAHYFAHNFCRCRSTLNTPDYSVSENKTTQKWYFLPANLFRKTFE